MSASQHHAYANYESPHSGFDRDDEWGYRSIEPSRTVISSIALVKLKTGVTCVKKSKLSHEDTTAATATQPSDATADATSDGGDDDYDISLDAAQMSTAQKLLLFWRKPARKCWWDGVEVDIPAAANGPSGETVKVKVWARRVWTLELSLVSWIDVCNHSCMSCLLT